MALLSSQGWSFALASMTRSSGAMTIAPPAAAAFPVTGSFAEGPSTGLAPLRLPQDLRLTPEQFALVCEANPEAVLELAADGQLITMTPTGGETGARNTLLCTRLQIWALARGGWKVFDSSSGFRLADGSVLSPDAAVLSHKRWQALSPEQRRGFPPLCPELVIELASASDAGHRGAEALRRKMAAYRANGAQLGWLLFPEQRAVEIWTAALPAARGRQGEADAEADSGADAPGASEAGAAMDHERLENAERLSGGDVLPGLVLELEEIWAG
jgi:Uma2 family endonuclease